MFVIPALKPIKTINQAPCFSCSMNFNNRGLACHEFCERANAWLAIQSEKMAHIARQEAAGVKTKGGTPRAQPAISRGEFEAKIIKSMRDAIEDHERDRRREKKDEVLEEIEKEVNEFNELVDRSEDDRLERAELSDKEISQLADDIMEEIEKEEEAMKELADAVRKLTSKVEDES